MPTIISLDKVLFFSEYVIFSRQRVCENSFSSFRVQLYAHDSVWARYYIFETFYFSMFPQFLHFHDLSYYKTIQLNSCFLMNIDLNTTSLSWISVCLKLNSAFVFLALNNLFINFCELRSYITLQGQLKSKTIKAKVLGSLTKNCLLLIFVKQKGHHICWLVAKNSNI